MRVLFVSPRCLIDPCNASAQDLHTLLEVLQSRGAQCLSVSLSIVDAVTPPFEQALAAPAGEWLEMDGAARLAIQQVRIQGVAHAVLKLSDAGPRMPSDVESQALMRAFCRYCESFRPDVIISYDWAPSNRQVGGLARKLGAKFLLYVASDRSSDAEMLEGADHILTASDHIRTRLDALTPAPKSVLRQIVDTARVRVETRVPEFVTFIDPVPEQGLSVVVSLARLARERQRPYRFLIVERRTTHRDAVARFPSLAACPNVSFATNVADMRQVYRRTSILLFPTLRIEPSGRAVIEANANAIPVLAYRVGGVEEVLDGAGFLFDPPQQLLADPETETPQGHAAEWLEIIDRLHSDAPFREDAESRAREADSRYSVDAVVDRLIAAVGAGLVKAGAPWPAQQAPRESSEGRGRRQDAPAISRALQLINAKQPREAAELLKTVLENEPNNAYAADLRGSCLLDLGDYDQARPLLERAVALNPRDVDAWNHLAICRRRQGEPGGAIAACEHALSIAPDHVTTLVNYAAVLTDASRYREAATVCRRIIALAPESAVAWANLGAAEAGLCNADEAVAAYKHAIELDPNFSEVWASWAYLLDRAGQRALGEQAFRKAIALGANRAEVLTALGSLLSKEGRYTEAAEYFEGALRQEPNTVSLWSSYLFCFNYVPDAEVASLFEAHRRFGEQIGPRYRQEWRPHSNERDRERTLNLGFVSADFHDHPVGRLLEGVLEYCDRQALTLTAYSNRSVGGDLALRLQRLFSRWCDIRSMNDAEVADQIRADRIDVLFDLSGHTNGNRLLVFARKPAPVQVSWLGYPMTTGLPAIDFFLTNRIRLPEAEAFRYAETPWYLPGEINCFRPPTDELPVVPPPALGGAPFTFGCFNNLAKVNERVLRRWSEILAAVPGSRLFLKAKELADPTAAERLRERLKSLGVTPERVLLEAFSPMADYLAAHQRVDLVLDTFPYAGGTTTRYGLWMGVPAVTLLADRMIGRVGASLMHSIGLPQFVAHTESEYVSVAVEWALKVDELARLRDGLRSRFLATLGDCKGFAQDFQNAVRGMWSAWCEDPEYGFARRIKRKQDVTAM